MIKNYIIEKQKINFSQIQDKTLAGFWKRLSAFVIDISLSIIMILCGSFVLIWIFRSLGLLFTPQMLEQSMFLLQNNLTYDDQTIKYFELLLILIIILSIISVLFYFWNRIYLQSRQSQSIGKMLLGLYIL